MSKRRIALLLLALPLVGWWLAPSGRTAPEADVKAEVMAADRAFYKAASDKGLDGWMSYLSDDVVRVAPLGGKGHVGKAAARKLDAPLFTDPNERLTWEPTDGGGFADKNLGWTTGRAKIVAKDGEVKWTGAYVTIWRKEAAGWRVILDTGAADPPKE